jgi:hypothetical protein
MIIYSREKVIFVWRFNAETYHSDIFLNYNIESMFYTMVIFNAEKSRQIAGKKLTPVNATYAPYYKPIYSNMTPAPDSTTVTM